MSEGFEECIDLSKEINDKIEQFARNHWIFTQDEWEDKVKNIKNSAIDEFVKSIEKNQTMQDNYFDAPRFEMSVDMTDILKIAEQLKGGAE